MLDWFSGSAVGYAVHRRAWVALQRRICYALHVKSDIFKFSIDMWIPGTSRNNSFRFLGPVHYVIPGVLQQRIKMEEHGQAMVGFASNCTMPYKYSSYLSKNVSTGQLLGRVVQAKTLG